MPDIYLVGRLPHRSPTEAVRALYRAAGLDDDLADPTDEVVVDARKGTYSGPFVTGRGSACAKSLNDFVASAGNVREPPFKAVTVGSILGV